MVYIENKEHITFSSISFSGHRCSDLLVFLQVVCTNSSWSFELGTAISFGFINSLSVIFVKLALKVPPGSVILENVLH